MLKYWRKSGLTPYSSIHESKSWYHYDNAIFGRCVTLTPSQRQIQYGIKEIFLQLLVNSTIYIHTPGMFSKGNKQLASKINVQLGKWYNLDVHHEVHELLDYGGALCNNDKTYNMDECNNNGTEKESLKMVGCTTPYGANKTNICTDANKGQKAYWDIYYYKFIYSFSEKNYEGCYYPCTYFIVSTKQDLVTTNPLGLDSAGVTLRFEQLIQETKSYYTYSELSMIAEIGGYVGLFLGISVNQMPYILDILGTFFARIRSLF